VSSKFFGGYFWAIESRVIKDFGKIVQEGQPTFWTNFPKYFVSRDSVAQK